MAIVSSSPAFAQNINPYNDGSQWAYGENVGWFNFEPGQGTGVTVAAKTVTGFVWQENIGWINLGAMPYGGVVNDGNGNLSGWAWGENVGWISFSCANTSSCGAVDYKVTIDANGDFHGWAWGENIGWIALNSASAGSAISFKVQTAYTTTTCPAPDLTAPDGATSTKPAFSWTKANDVAWYEIMVWSEARGGIVANPWFGPTACSGSTCTAAQLGTALPAGNNWWWLNVWYGDNKCGFVEMPGGNWKLAVVAGCTVPSLTSPDNAVIAAGTKPTFTFTDTGAEWYNIQVWTSAGYLALNQWEDAAQQGMCIQGTCSKVSTNTFPAGTTNWWWLNTWSQDCGFQMQPGGHVESFTVTP